MFDAFWEPVRTLLGLGKEDLNAAEMAVRATITFAITLAIVRFGDKRMFGKGTAFDTVVAIMIGSVMSRGITGQSPFVATVVAGAVLVGLHWLLAFFSYRLEWVGPLVKGNAVSLVKDGEVQQRAVRKGAVSRLDLEQAIRAQGVEPDVSQIKYAVMERDGSISVIPADSEPRVLDITVQDGVQTVRIALD